MHKYKYFNYLVFFCFKIWHGIRLWGQICKILYPSTLFFFRPSWGHWLYHQTENTEQCLISQQLKMICPSDWDEFEYGFAPHYAIHRQAKPQMAWRSGLTTDLTSDLRRGPVTVLGFLEKPIQRVLHCKRALNFSKRERRTMFNFKEPLQKMLELIASWFRTPQQKGRESSRTWGWNFIGDHEDVAHKDHLPLTSILLYDLVWASLTVHV